MASIFGDESADAKAQEVFAVAGIIGFDWQWDMVVKDWLAITKGEEFHATEWETKYANDPDKNKHRERQESYKQLTRIIRLSGLRGWGVAVDLAGFRAAFPGTTQDHAYHKCFVEVADRLLREAEKWGYSDLKFTFDGRQGQGTTGLLYDYISSQPEWTDLLSFADKMGFGNRKNPCIQIADLVARETMKGLERHSRGLPLRKSLVALASSNYRFQFDYLMAEYFAQWRAKVPELENLTGIKGSEYFAWLEKKKLRNNLNSQIRYLIWLDAKKLRVTNGT